MWTPKEAGGLGAALRPPNGSRTSPWWGPRGRSPRKLADSGHFGCKYPTLWGAFPAYFFSNFMLFCGDVGVNKIRIMGWKSSNLIEFSITRHNVLNDCLVGCFEDLRQFIVTWKQEI